MPIIRVELLAGRSVEQKREFARSVTELASDILGCSQASVAVIFDDVARHDWANGGHLESDKAAGKT
ncbi:MAG: 4-oxalocrotonate tautomerase [Alphaproteobacteria bacterium]|jgi:4-oxalocrotonate tautomerase|nr:4-oxalocrotonate tautomerase [Alphaproteobacteria bacterium]MBU0806010.1 4-oxalocrotonate tautomerase [Alphaproteobacteria bacterium]MBU0874021.1 4-oxalocrotonate tautomerase [Alphaproteobacteria bacterium]MBU1402155.1 4-oxalocrotonate tautomerase [Alphaproteobacteria bacterium]MBU1590800.1 4-oxalocrotonate tautomerase [Alphaproteobacteria bacterium]